MCTIWIVEQLAHRIIEVFTPYIANTINKLEEKYKKTLENFNIHSYKRGCNGV